MTRKHMITLLLAWLCLLALSVGAGIGFSMHADAQRESDGQRRLAGYLHVARLPASARVLECRDYADSCDPDNFSTTCFVRIAPRDFELLYSQARLRANEHNCPENFSYSHMMGMEVGPSFKINEEHWGGTAQTHVAVYPDAAHTQFIAVMSRPSRLTCFH
jgi:hypothetical protein